MEIPDEWKQVKPERICDAFKLLTMGFYVDVEPIQNELVNCTLWEKYKCDLETGAADPEKGSATEVYPAKN